MIPTPGSKANRTRQRGKLALAGIGALLFSAVTLSRFLYTPAEKVLTLVGPSPLCTNAGRLTEAQLPFSFRGSQDLAVETRQLREAQTILGTQIHDERDYAVLHAMIEACLGNYDSALQQLLSPETSGDADALTVASVAYLSRGIKRGSTLDLLQAAHSIRLANKVRPEDRVILTNYIEILDKLRLVDTRRDMLRRSLQVENSQAWIEVNKEILARLKQRLATNRQAKMIFSNSVAVLSTPRIKRWIKQFPYQARKVVEEKFLGEWGKTWRDGNRADSETLLNAAELISRTLWEELGDRLLWDAVVSIRRASGPHLREQAEGLATFQYGMQLYRDRNSAPDEALRSLERSSSLLKEADCSFWLWPEFYSIVLQSFADSEQSAERWETLLEEIPDTYLALRGHIAWRLGIALQLAGDATGALPLFEGSIKPLEASSGKRGAAFAHNLIANTLSDLGLSERSWQYRLEAFDRVLVTGDRWQRHSMLHGAADSLIRLREPQLAFPFLDELEINDRLWNQSPALAEFYFERARALAGVGDYLGARENVSFGRAVIEKLPAGVISSRLNSAADIAEGLSLSTSDPLRAIRLLRGGYLAQVETGYSYENLPVLGGLLQANRSRGDFESLAQAQSLLLAELVRLRGGLESPADRAVAGSVLENVVDSIVGEGSILSDRETIAAFDLLKPSPAHTANHLAGTDHCRGERLIHCVQDLLAENG